MQRRRRGGRRGEDGDSGVPTEGEIRLHEWLLRHGFRCHEWLKTRERDRKQTQLGVTALRVHA